jgi:hypothetical protein
MHLQSSLFKIDGFTQHPNLMQTAAVFSCLTHSQVYADRFQEYICEIDGPLCCL